MTDVSPLARFSDKTINLSHDWMTGMRGGERVLELLEQWPAGPFYKEDGEMIIDAEGHAI